MRILFFILFFLFSCTCSALLGGENFRFGNPVQQFQQKLKGDQIKVHYFYVQCMLHYYNNVNDPCPL